MTLIEEIKKNANINEMAEQDFRGPTGIEKAKNTILAVYKNYKAGKKSSKDYTMIITTARKALIQDNAVKNKKFIENANEALKLIKKTKDKLGSQQARIDSY